MIVGAKSNNTYKSVRIIGQGYNLQYVVWCTMEHELYDLDVSSLFQVHSLKHFCLTIVFKVRPFTDEQPIPVFNSNTLLGLPTENVVARLDALLLVLKSCKGSACVQPWNVLHPEGDVQDLSDALDPKFDDFYLREQNRVSFSWCAPGQILSAEGAMEALVYRGASWDQWA